MPYNLVNYTFRRIHKNGGRADEPGVEHENEAFSTGQKKNIRRVLKCFDSMLLNSVYKTRLTLTTKFTLESVKLHERPAHTRDADTETHANYIKAGFWVARPSKSPGPIGFNHSAKHSDNLFCMSSNKMSHENYTNVCKTWDG